MSATHQGRGRPHGLRQVGAALGGLLDPVAAKRGFGTARLVAAWTELVGETMAGWTRPEKLAFPRGAATGGVLTVAVGGARAVLLQHELPQLAGRINAFLGFAAVAEIRLVQRPFAASAAPAPPVAVPAAERQALEGRVSGVEDAGLRDSLRRLGEAMLAARLAKE